jgi:mannose-6-phosphate isomerase
MLYPLKLTPIYKHSLWGGRALEKLGRRLPKGQVGESWEVSCHPDGVNVIANGKYIGIPLTDWLKAYKDKAVGRDIYLKYATRFPMLIKLIDASDKLSVQVHPSDEMAKQLENEFYGKNEMWYILSAKPDAKVICDFKPGFKRSAVNRYIEENRLEKWLNYIDIEATDVVYVPAGKVHSLGEGIVALEIQQNSNITYRIYDYNRVTQSGKQRQLHIEKALEAMSDQPNAVHGKIRGLRRLVDSSLSVTFLVANDHFAVELYELHGNMEETTDGEFFIFSIVEGEGELVFNKDSLPIQAVETVLIPAALGKYQFCGKLTMLKTYVPKIKAHIVDPLIRAGYTYAEIMKNVHGCKLSA